MVRAALGVFVVASAVLVLVPTGRPVAPDLATLTPWAAAPTLWLGNVAALLALGIAAALALRSWNETSRDLCAFLAMGATAWGVMTLDALSASGPDFRASVVAGLGLLTTAGFARFWLAFPRPLSEDDLRRAPSRPRPSWFARRRTAHGEDAAHLDPKDVERTVRTQRNLVRWMVRPAWWIALVLASAAVLLHRSVADDGLWLLTFAPGLFLAMVGMGLAQVQYRVAEGVQRRRMLWMVEGLFVALLCLAVGGQVIVVSGSVGAPDLMGAYPLICTLAALVFVVAIAIAAFFEGVLDPALALRRTAVYGVLAGLMVFLFAVVENVVSEGILALFGVSESLGGPLGGGVVALVFLPCQKWLELQVQSYLPATERERETGGWADSGTEAPPRSSLES